MLFALLVAASTLAIVVGGMVWRFWRAGAASSPASNELNIRSVADKTDNYRAMTRLFADEDLTFLARHRVPKDICKRFHSARWRALKLYVRELHGDFRSVYAVCRTLAMQNEDPAFATLLAREAARFYLQLLALHVLCFLRWHSSVRAETANLVNSLVRLREAGLGLFPEAATVTA